MKNPQIIVFLQLDAILPLPFGTWLCRALSAAGLIALPSSANSLFRIFALIITGDTHPQFSDLLYQVELPKLDVIKRIRNTFLFLYALDQFV